LPCPTAIATRAAPPPTSFRCMPRCRVDAWMGRRRWTSTLDIGRWMLGGVYLHARACVAYIKTLCAMLLYATALLQVGRVATLCSRFVCCATG
jgi:hypothetical protein